MLFPFRYAIVVFTFLPGILSSRVLELSDKFIDISTEGLWFVKFYAPWCAHCRRLEPVWAHVAQSLYNSPIKVAKVDCTRFTSIATHFKIRAYPTILFIKGTFQHEYTGDRNKKDMLSYALRMSQPAVQRVSEADNISYIKEMHPLFFGYVGKQKGLLWEMFSLHAEKYQPHAWFFSMSHELVKNELQPPSNTALFVYKEDEAYFLESHLGISEDKDYLNATINKWINVERFGLFPKITRSNIKHLMDTEKYIVLAVVSENKLNEITQTEQDFVDMIQGIIKKKKSELHDRFQFGWTGSLDLANSIVMSELRVPNLLVINSTTSHHYLPDDDPMLMTPEAVLLFLDQVHNQLAPTYGGNSWPVRMYRGFYEARSTLSNMWHGNPVLTALVFGLPLGFLSLICYSACCADILDAEEEDNYSETHEKKD